MIKVSLSAVSAPNAAATRRMFALRVHLATTGPRGIG